MASDVIIIVVAAASVTSHDKRLVIGVVVGRVVCVTAALADGRRFVDFMDFRWQEMLANDC
jgi:hypothetical protein